MKHLTARKLAFFDALTVDASLSDVDCRVAARLLRYYNHNVGCAWPSPDRLAEEIHCSERTVRRSIKRLEAAGWFTIIVGGKGRGQTNQYVPRFDRLGVAAHDDIEDAEGSPAPVEAPNGGHACPPIPSTNPDKGGHTCPPSAAKGGQDCPQKGDRRDQKGGHQRPPKPFNKIFNTTTRARPAPPPDNGAPQSRLNAIAPTREDEAIEAMARRARTRPNVAKALLGKLDGDERRDMVTRQLAGTLSDYRLNEVLLRIQRAESGAVA